MKPSNRVKYLNISDWRAAKAAGHDPGKRPAAPLDRYHSGSGNPVIEPVNPVASVGGLHGSDYADELRRGRRSRKVDALIEELGLKPMRRKRTVRALGRVIR